MKKKICTDKKIKPIIINNQKYLPLSSVLKLPRNAKDHDIGGLSISMERFGYMAPILVNPLSGYLLAGHGRVDTLNALKKERREPPRRILIKNKEWLIPMFPVDLDPKEDEPASLSDNQHVFLGGWHQETLREILVDLEEQGRLLGTGFDSDDLKSIISRVDGRAPESFKEYTENIETEYQCPKCKYEWSGQPKPE